MPFPLLPVLSLAAGIGTQLFNSRQQNRANARQEAFAREMYSTQRRDALADWDMMNAYNSPFQQMERLKAAGLNPNLVYGHGVAGNAAGEPRGSSAGSISPKPASIDALSVLGAYQQIELVNAQIDKVRQDTQIGLAQEDKIKSETTRTDWQTRLLRVKEGIERLTQGETVESRIVSLNRLKQLTDTAYYNQELIEEKLSFLRRAYPKELDKLAYQVEIGRIDVKAALLKLVSLELDNEKTVEEIENLKFIREKIIAETDLKELEYALKPIMGGSNILESLYGMFRSMRKGGIKLPQHRVPTTLPNRYGRYY